MFTVLHARPTAASTRAAGRRIALLPVLHARWVSVAQGGASPHVGLRWSVKDRAGGADPAAASRPRQRGQTAIPVRAA